MACSNNSTMAPVRIRALNPCESHDVVAEKNDVNDVEDVVGSVQTVVGTSREYFA